MIGSHSMMWTACYGNFVVLQKCGAILVDHRVLAENEWDMLHFLLHGQIWSETTGLKSEQGEIEMFRKPSLCVLYIYTCSHDCDIT